jgi:hypothetical protein
MKGIGIRTNDIRKIGQARNLKKGLTAFSSMEYFITFVLL